MGHGHSLEDRPHILRTIVLLVPFVENDPRAQADRILHFRDHRRDQIDAAISSIFLEALQHDVPDQRRAQHNILDLGDLLWEEDGIEDVVKGFSGRGSAVVCLLYLETNP